MVASRYVDVDGIRTHYLEGGEGRTVVLLHSGEFGAAAEISWEYTIGALAERYRVVAPDWLGYGRTDKVHDFTSGVARRIRHLKRFLEVLAIDKADFIGNSMGGSVFARVLGDGASFPVRTFTMISSGGFTPVNDDRRAMMAYDCTRESMRATVAAMFHDPKWAADEAYVEKRYQMSALPGAWECTAAARFKSPLVPAREEFGLPDATQYEKLGMPVLLIAGAEDKLREPGYALKLAKRIPHCEVHVIENCGHCAHIEHSGQVNRLLLDFLAKDRT